MAQRDLKTVIDAMVNEVPEEGYDSLHDELASIRNSVVCASPEMMRTWWVHTAEALEDGIGDPAGVAWKARVQDIFADKIKVGA